MSLQSVQMPGESLKDGIIVAVLVGLLFGNVYQCFCLRHQLEQQDKKLQVLKSEVDKINAKLDDVVEDAMNGPR